MYLFVEDEWRRRCYKTALSWEVSSANGYQHIAESPACHYTKVSSNCAYIIKLCLKYHNRVSEKIIRGLMYRVLHRSQDTGANVARGLSIWTFTAMGAWYRITKYRQKNITILSNIYTLGIYVCHGIFWVESSICSSRQTYWVEQRHTSLNQPKMGGCCRSWIFSFCT